MCSICQDFWNIFEDYSFYIYIQQKLMLYFLASTKSWINEITSCLNHLKTLFHAICHFKSPWLNPEYTATMQYNITHCSMKMEHGESLWLCHEVFRDKSHAISSGSYDDAVAVTHNISFDIIRISRTQSKKEKSK